MPEDPAPNLLQRIAAINAERPGMKEPEDLGLREMSNKLLKQTHFEEINKSMSILNHYISDDIDRAMKNNFEYESKIVETLFDRY